MKSKKIPILFIGAIFLMLLAGSALAQNLKVSSSSYNPAPALPGTTMKLTITINNTGPGDAKDVIAELDLTGGKSRETKYPFSLGTGVSATEEIGDITTSQSATIKYDVLIDPAALNGDYTINVSYGEKGSPLKTEKITISILSRKPQVELIKSDASEAVAGKTTTINLTIRNVGSDNAKDVLVGFTEDRTVTTTGTVVERPIAPLGASYEYVEGLGPGQEKTFQFAIAADPGATLKTYMMPVTLKFKDENYNEYTDTRYIGFKIVQEPELDAGINSVTPAAYPGGTSEVSFDLYNTGIGPAKYIVAKTTLDVGKIDNGKIFVGTLEADDYDSYKEKITINSDAAPGTYPVKVVLEYKDQYGEAKSIEKTTMLKVVSAAEATGVGAGTIIIGIISLLLEIIGIIAVARFLYKRFKKKK